MHSAANSRSCVGGSSMPKYGEPLTSDIATHGVTKVAPASVDEISSLVNLGQRVVCLGHDEFGRLILEIDIGERLAGVVAHDEAGFLFFDSQGRREAAGGQCSQFRFAAMPHRL